jgi:hypothetical protein
MHRGYIKFYRKMLEWGWFKSSETYHAFGYLLLKANHKKTIFMQHIIERGQLVFGRKQASYDTGISEQSWRTCLERLKSTSEIAIKSTNKFSIITIINFNNYQVIENENQPAYQPADQHSINQQSTTSKECKNEKNKDICPFTPLLPGVATPLLPSKLKESKIKEREEAFRLSLQAFSEMPETMRGEFFRYWTEPNKTGTKMRFELQETWDLKRRLITWANRSKTDTSAKNPNGWHWNPQ